MYENTAVTMTTDGGYFLEAKRTDQQETVITLGAYEFSERREIASYTLTGEESLRLAEYLETTVSIGDKMVCVRCNKEESVVDSVDGIVHETCSNCGNEVNADPAIFTEGY